MEAVREHVCILERIQRQGFFSTNLFQSPSYCSKPRIERSMMRSTTQGAMFVAALTLAPLVFGLLLATAAGTRPLLLGLLARHLEKEMFFRQSGLMKACSTGFFPPEKPFTLYLQLLESRAEQSSPHCHSNVQNDDLQNFAQYSFLNLICRHFGLHSGRSCNTSLLCYLILHF
jgi:hypothetical protein